jgi:hypothetical protein
LCLSGEPRNTCLAAIGGSRTPSTPSVCRQSAWSRPHDGAPRGRFVDARSRHEVNAPARTSQNRSRRLSCRGHVSLHHQEGIGVYRASGYERRAT